MTEFTIYIVHVYRKGLEDFMETFHEGDGDVTYMEFTSKLGGYLVTVKFSLQQKEVESRLNGLITRGEIKAYKLVYSANKLG